MPVTRKAGLVGSALAILFPAGLAAQWQLEPVFEIGAIDGAPYELFQFPIASGRLGENFWVADRLIGVIRVFTPDGAFVHQFGAAGQGPSEFAFLQTAWSSDDGLVVSDPRQNKLVLFSSEGDFESTVALPGFYPSAIGVDRDGLLWLSLSDSIAQLDRPGFTRHVMEVSAFDSLGGVVATSMSPSGLVRYDDYPFLFSPLADPVVVGGLVYIADPASATIHWRSTGGSGSFDVDLPEPPTQEEAARMIRARIMEDGSSPLTERLETLPLEGRTPTIARLLAGEDEIWVKSYDPLEDSQWLGGWAGGEGGRWTVVDRGGCTLGSVVVPPSVTPLAVDGEFLLARRRGEFDVQHFTVFRIRRGRE